MSEEKQEVSIIVPAYNEEKRIGEFLDELQEFCTQNLQEYEIIIVNDGSKDNTVKIVNDLRTEKTRLIDYPGNQGKGYAVKKGMLSAKYEQAIFIDADGAIKPNEILRMLEKLKENSCVVGSRNLPESKAHKDFFRKILSFGFNNYVSFVFWLDYSDYLCGFKGFNLTKTRKVWEEMTQKRWIFDVELFYRLKKAGLKAYELPIAWEHKDDSKMTLWAIVKIFFGILKLRFL